MLGRGYIFSATGSRRSIVDEPRGCGCCPAASSQLLPDLYDPLAASDGILETIERQFALLPGHFRANRLHVNAAAVFACSGKIYQRYTSMHSCAYSLRLLERTLPPLRAPDARLSFIAALSSVQAAGAGSAGHSSSKGDDVPPAQRMQRRLNGACGFTCGEHEKSCICHSKEHSCSSNISTSTSTGL